MIRLYAGVAVVAVLIGAWIRYDYVTEQNEQLKSDIAVANVNLTFTKSILDIERTRATAAGVRMSEVFAQRAENDEYVKGLESCIADKSCGVRVVPGACPAVPNTGTDARGAEAAHAASKVKFEQDYIALIESIGLTEINYAWMQKELAIRSHPDYCTIKKANN